jgi:recombination protein RecT
MSNITVQSQQSNQLPIERLFEDASITTQVIKLLGNKSTQFVTSIVQLVSSSDSLKNCDPTSIYQCAVMAALLDFPINNNLGYAYIIPYGNKAQFQMSYKGYVQLAIRSGEYETIGASPIYEGQLVSENPLTGFVFDFSNKKRYSNWICCPICSFKRLLKDVVYDG